MTSLSMRRLGELIPVLMCVCAQLNLQIRMMELYKHFLFFFQKKLNFFQDLAKIMNAAALLVVQLIVGDPVWTPSCSSDTDCSLLGVCTNGACKCDPGKIIYRIYFMYSLFFLSIFFLPPAASSYTRNIYVPSSFPVGPHAHCFLVPDPRMARCRLRPA